MARLSQGAQIPAWVVIDQDSEMNPILVILFNSLDSGGLALKYKIENIRTFARSKTDTVARPEVNGSNPDCCQWSPL